MKEVWKTFRDHYQVSNLGRIKSLPRTHNRKGKRYLIIEKILRVHPKPIYLGIKLQGTNYYVHVLVLENFVSLRPGGHEARHKDGNPMNNSSSNLCWGTRKQNAADRVVHGTAGCISVIREDGEVFTSVSEAARTNKTTSGKISAVCKGKRNKTTGFSWRYA